MAQGTVKHYDLETHQGSLLMEDGTEVVIDPVSTEASNEIRYLRLGQRVDFVVIEEDGRKVARILHIVSFA
jgi:cold shock CspA family protein